ncbi:hypothetical protein ACIRRA_44345 [Nocardia sp. NPDC101769]|uniref:hypothetical protein n=1 Tax=Nocardia sp. NPDC101769 TaxID=3364333 RepID=UPI003830B394
MSRYGYPSDARDRASAPGSGGGEGMDRLADLHVLCAQIHRWQSMIAIGDELYDRYPELWPVLSGLDGAADLIQADIGIRRQLCDAEIVGRTADFTTIPDRIRGRWRVTADDLLAGAYLRYQCAAIAAASTGPATLAELYESSRAVGP